MKRGYRYMAPDERQNIYSMANKGLPYKVIANALDRSRGTISNVISQGILGGQVQRRNERKERRRQ